MDNSDRPTLVLWTSFNCLLIALALAKHGGFVEVPEGGADREGASQAVLPLGSPSPSCLV